MRTLYNTILSCALLVTCLYGISSASTNDPNDNVTSEKGLYQVSYDSRVQPVPLNEIHAWVVEVRDAQGKPVNGARISIDGGMPAHGHSLPTKPRVTEELGNGRYLVDGLKFQMPGEWVIDLFIESPAGSDEVRIELPLGAGTGLPSDQSGHQH